MYDGGTNFEHLNLRQNHNQDSAAGFDNDANADYG